jgi:hypothetical protein
VAEDSPRGVQDGEVITAKLAAAPVRLEEAKGLLVMERSGQMHSVLVEKDGERRRSSIEAPRWGRGGW